MDGETPSVYLSRINKHGDKGAMLYRTIRCLPGVKKLCTDATKNKVCPADSVRCATLTTWAGQGDITPCDTTCTVNPIIQVAGGNRATQFISTSKEKAGAAINTIINWGAAGEWWTRLRRIASWDPVIQIDVSKLTDANQLYDLADETKNREYFPEGADSISAQGVAGQAIQDSEVLITGTIPEAAITLLVGRNDPVAMMDLGGLLTEANVKTVLERKGENEILQGWLDAKDKKKREKPAKEDDGGSKDGSRYKKARSEKTDLDSDDDEE